MLSIVLACHGLTTAPGQQQLADTAQSSPSDERDKPDADVRLPGETICDDVQAIFDARCTDCHGLTASAGLDLRDAAATVDKASTQADLVLVAPGAPADSYLLHKLEDTHLDVGGAGFAMPPDGLLDTADVATVRQWIEDDASCEDDTGPKKEEEVSDYDPNTLDQDTLFVCDGAPSSSPARLRLVDGSEWRASAGKDLDHLAASNPLRGAADDYSTYPASTPISAEALDLYLGVVEAAGGAWTDPLYGDGQAWEPRYDDDLECMFDDEEPSRDCIETWVGRYLERGALFRPPTADEIARLADYAETALATETAREDALLEITAAAWMTPEALFVNERGTSAPDEHGRSRLPATAAARVVGRMISDRGVGASSVYLYENDLDVTERWTDGTAPHLEALALAAADGTIEDPEVLKDLVRQHVAGTDPAREDERVHLGTHSSSSRAARAEAWMADKLDRFFVEYFDIEGFSTGFHDTVEATSAYDGDGTTYDHQDAYEVLRAGSVASREPTGTELFLDTIARIVVEDEDVFFRLLTTQDWYLAADDGLTSNLPFGVEESLAEDREARWVTLPADQRAGVLTHPVWLGAHGDAFEDGPSLVLRGKWIREQLFCETVPPLELVTVDASLPDNDGTQTARQRVEAHIETNAECMVCHQSMNSLGKPFEIYNHAGFLRDDDHGVLPDGTTTVVNAPDAALNRDYVDALDLSDALATSDHAKRCFLRHTFRFFAGRDETMADACALADMEAAYDESGGSFIAVLETLAAHDVVMQRVEEVE